MSLFSKIRGTIETIFQLGLNGPQLKNNSGVIEARDNVDGAFVITRGLTPVGPNDYATKNYVDSGTLGGTIREIRFAVTNTPASQSSATSIPANANVCRVRLNVTTPFSAGATIAIGQTGSTSLLEGTSDNNPQAANIYEVIQDTAWGASALPVLVTIGGAPAAGAAVCIVEYSTPAN